MTRTLEGGGTASEQEKGGVESMTPGREHLKQGVEAGQSEGQTSCFTQIDSVCWEAVCNNSEGID